METLIMSAPNGARKTKSDHPALPLTISETVAAAKSAHKAGAAMLHAHVRDDNHAHTLDHGLYHELLAEMAMQCPMMPCQITTEAVGKFSPQEQRDCLMKTHPQYASIAVREISAENLDFAVKTYCEAHEAQIHIQHILYDINDLALLKEIFSKPQLNSHKPDILYVIGKYSPDFTSHPDELTPLLEADLGFTHSWMVCAFGPREFDVMVKAAEHGGHARIGFENNLYLKDGTIAPDNAALIKQFSDQVTPAQSPAGIFNLYEA